MYFQNCIIFPLFNLKSTLQCFFFFILFYWAAASRCISHCKSHRTPLHLHTRFQRFAFKRLLHDKIKSAHTGPECIPGIFSPRCPFPFTFGKRSSDIVRVLSCMLILWPWQRADPIAESGEGSKGRVGGCSGQILMTRSGARLKTPGEDTPTGPERTAARGFQQRWHAQVAARSPAAAATMGRNCSTSAPSVSEALMASSLARSREWAEKISLRRF